MKIEDFLKEYEGLQVYYKPNPGNGGDALIAYATHLLFAKSGIDYQMIYDDVNLDDKIVFFGGGGNLVSYYNHCADFIRNRCQKVRKFILLPHTINGHVNLLSEMGSNFTIFCRESVSYEYVRSFENIKDVYLTDDLVLGLDINVAFKGLPPAPRLITLVKPRHMLASVYKKKISPSFFLKRFDSSRVLSAFRQDAELSEISIPDDNVDVTGLINLDESMLDMAKVRETCYRIFRFINQFETVNTNRLHVCISAALLGKKVNFYGNSYYKNRSVYDHSIKGHFPNVTWKVETP